MSILRLYSLFGDNPELENGLLSRFSSKNTSPKDGAKRVRDLPGWARMGSDRSHRHLKRRRFQVHSALARPAKPYQHQVANLITFCRRLPVTLLADDVGLGKTISAGLIMSELIARSRLAKILIVCPKLLGPQWKEELDTKFDIPAQVVSGQALLRAEPEGIGAVITTYNSARLHLDAFPTIASRCSFLMKPISCAIFTA